jgi:hypothetical protein
MKEIKALEQLLGEGYAFGPVPRIRKNTWLNRYVDYIRDEIKENNKFKPSFLFQGIKNELREKCPNPAYYSGTHTIMINSKEALFHELVHAYTRNRNPELYEKGTKLRETFFVRLVNGNLSRKDVENMIISNSVIEGIAYYLEGEYRNQAVKPGTKLNGLSDIEANSFYESGEKLTQGFLKISTEDRAEKREKILKGIKLLDEYTARVGYYLARSWCEAHPECSRGMIIDNLIQEPPYDVKDLQEIILHNMKISANLKNSF